MSDFKQQPAVSVIIPVYKGREYFAELLPLLLNQTLQNIEFIFIDDRGPDDSFSLAETAAKEDERVVLLRNEQNKGPGLSRNFGLSVARGEYVAFVDSDDLIPIDFYERLYAKAKETGALVVKCGRAKRFVDGKLEISNLNKIIIEKLNRGEHLVNSFGWEHQSAIYQRLHALRNCARNSDAKQDEDTTFILSFTHNVQPNQFAMIEDLFYYYRVSSDSLTRKLDGHFLTESIKSMIDKFDYILEQDHSNALMTYVAILLENRLNWRFKGIIHEQNITKEQKMTYLTRVIEIARDYLQRFRGVRLYGTSKMLINGELSINQYFQQLISNDFKTVSTTSSPSAVKFDEERWRLLLLKSWVLRNTWRYKILSIATFGKTRSRYKEKYKKFQCLHRACKKATREMISIMLLKEH